MKVIKRSGKLEDFNPEKIKNAVIKAYDSVGEQAPDSVINHICNSVEDLIKSSKNEVSVEAIQDTVEQTMCFNGCFKAAKSFIIYRDKHAEIRRINDRIDYIDKCCGSKETTATLSEVDANANVQNKNAVTIESEVWKANNKEIQRAKMKKQLNINYPEVADQYEIDVENHIIYPHDESSSPLIKPYCAAVSMYPFMLRGSSCVDNLGTTEPKNLTSFCGQFNNLVFLLSAQLKGAVAYAELFNVMAYYCAKEFGESFYLREKIVVFDTGIKKRTISDIIEQCFQNIVCTINQPAGNRSFQSPFTNISYYDSNYWHSLFADFVYPDGTKPNWDAVNYLQKKFIKWFNKERTKVLYTFPVETMALLSDGDNKIIDEEYEDLAAEMYSEGHSFFTYISDNPDGLSSCCRLRSSIEANEFSFTNGLTGVATGSVNVISLNFNRITQNFFKERFNECGDIYDVQNKAAESWKQDADNVRNDFKQYLIAILERVYKYHIAYRQMLEVQIEQGNLPMYDAGFISLKQQFNTIGISGVNEAAEFLMIECRDNADYEEFCKIITSTISEQNKLHRTKKIKFNCEFVPGESLGVKNFNWDKADGYIVPTDGRNCYNSYFYKPDDPNVDILEKFRLHGRRYTDTLDGGVALHLNLDSNPTKKQCLAMIRNAVKQGTNYFTINVPQCQCNDCKHIEKHPFKVCPVCGSSNVTLWTRIIGYLRPVVNFGKARLYEFGRRVFGKYGDK